MYNADEICREIRSTFALQPIPENALRSSANFWAASDIWSSLNASVVGRRWDTLTLQDWAMVGTNPGIARYYLSAEAFHYYLPSILAEVCSTGQYPEFAIEAISPPHISNFDVQAELKIWWHEFVVAFNQSEKHCIFLFAEHLKQSEKLFDEERAILENAWWI